MKVRLLLANHIEIHSNMLYAMGIGWTQIGPAPSPFAIGAIVEVMWEETNRPYRLTFDIIDVDGQPFNVPTPVGDQPLRIVAEFRTGRPPDAPPGTTFLAPVAANLPPVPLQPGRQYVARALIGDQVMDEVNFRVRPQPQPVPGAP